MITQHNTENMDVYGKKATETGIFDNTIGFSGWDKELIER